MLSLLGISTLVPRLVRTTDETEDIVLCLSCLKESCPIGGGWVVLIVSVCWWVSIFEYR